MAGAQAPSETNVALVCCRLRDFFARNTPWHRRLWNVGTVLALREVAEYADDCLRGSVVKTEGLRYVVESTRREVQRDPGVGHIAGELDSTLAQLDKTSVKDISSQAVDELQQLTRRADLEYCERWGKTQAAQPVEFMARAIASHLLDGGLSSEHLHRWLQRRQTEFKSVSDLAEAVSTMNTEMTPHDFEVLVPCTPPYVHLSGSSGLLSWKDGHQAAGWIREHCPEVEGGRQNGGFVVRVTERDPWAAVEAARSVIARADARARVARIQNQGIQLTGWALVGGSRRRYSLSPSHHHGEIGSLDRQGAIYRFDGVFTPELDDALELASYMASSSAGAAISGGWAAIEGLLIRPGETGHHQAADRLAALIACSFPRAEMTPLAYAHTENSSDALSHALQRSRSNYERVCLLEVHLRQGKPLALVQGSDVAAVERVSAILIEPAESLRRIRRYVTESLRRLYNQRNVIAHSGSFRSRALNATARTAFFLLGAGLDRIVHAQVSDAASVSPLDLVARAETELRLIGTQGGRLLSSLLE